jgi:hypothetical protein
MMVVHTKLDIYDSIIKPIAHAKFLYKSIRGRRVRGRIIVRITTTCVISAYHH